MKIGIRLILSLLAGSFFMFSCNWQSDPLFHAPGAGDTQYLQFINSGGLYQMTPTDLTPFDVVIGAKILGPVASEDVTVTVEVISSDVNLESEVVFESLTFVIPKNSFSGSTKLTVNPGSFELSEDIKKLNIKLNSNLTPAPYGAEASFEFIYKACPFDIADFTGPYDCDEEGYAVYDVALTKDPDVPNRIHNSNFWDWAAAGETVYYDFDGTADQLITIPDQPFVFGDGTEGSVSGTGTYNSCDGTFVCDYDVVYSGTVYPTHHVFIPQ